MFPATLQVEEFEPSEKLVLEQSILDWRVLPRLAVSLFFLPFLLAPLLPLLISLGVSGPSGGTESTGAGLLVLILLLMFMVFWYGMLAGFVYLAGLILGCWNRVALDRTNRELSLTYEGYFIWGQGTTTIPLDRIRDVTVNVTGRGDEEVTIQLKIRYRTEAGEEDTASPRFRVRHVDLVEEAIALSSAVAQIIGLKSMEMERSDHLETSFVLSRERPPDTADDDERIRPIPSIQSDLNFEEDTRARIGGGMGTGVQFGRPEIDLPPFDPEEHLGSSFTSYNEPEIRWDPGERVMINVPPMPNWARLLASGITGGVAGVVIPAVLGGPIVFLLESVGLSLSLEGTGILIGCIGFGGTWYGLGRRYCRRRTELDWHAGTYALQIGTRSSNGSLEKIQAFVVKGYRHKGDDDSPTTYDCKLIVDLDDGRETIFWTDKKTDRENVYRQAGSMAEDLADALGIEWKWKGFE